VWALWHWPLFFLKGYYHSTLGFGSSAFWFFNLSILVGGVVYAWLYNKAGRVAVAAVFYHAIGNLGRVMLEVNDVGFKMEGIDVVELIDFTVEAMIAVVVVLGARRLMFSRVTTSKREA
jgi:membrane protease YdiL (CAAX protease family)